MRFWAHTWESKLRSFLARESSHHSIRDASAGVTVMEMPKERGDNVETSEKTKTETLFSKESTSESEQKNSNSKTSTSDAKVMTVMTTALRATGIGDPALIKSLSLEVARPSVHRQVQLAKAQRGAPVP
eukprot:s1184_g10.t1